MFGRFGPEEGHPHKGTENRDESTERNRITETRQQIVLQKTPASTSPVISENGSVSTYLLGCWKAVAHDNSIYILEGIRRQISWLSEFSPRSLDAR